MAARLGAGSVGHASRIVYSPGSRRQRRRTTWRVFRAKQATARLTVTDRKNATTPAGPIGQELMFNFIEIQPYHEN